HAVAVPLPGKSRGELAERLELGHGQVSALRATRRQSQLAQDLGDGVPQTLRRWSDVHIQAGTFRGELLGEACITDEHTLLRAEEDDGVTRKVGQAVPDARGVRHSLTYLLSSSRLCCSLSRSASLSTAFGSGAGRLLSLQPTAKPPSTNATIHQRAVRPNVLVG